MIKHRIPSPLADGFAELRQAPDTQTFRKEEFAYVYHCYECEITKERFTTPELDNINTAQIYNQYREQHQFLFPEQITRLRERYGLTAARLALLGKVVSHDAASAVLQVAQESLTATVTTALATLPVSDLTVENAPLEEVMSDLFSQNRQARAEAAER